MDGINMCDYVNASCKYRPDKIKCLFIAESPPAYKSDDKKSYFYFENNPGSDILFATLILALYNINYRKTDRNKSELLNKFKSDGYWLMDVVEYPINRLNGGRINPKEREQIIREHIPDFLRHLNSLKNKNIFTLSSGIIIIKKLNYEILNPVLLQHGFAVLNKGKIDFPKYYWDRDTVNGIQLALKNIQNNP
jgi:hypothetical protein